MDNSTPAPVAVALSKEEQAFFVQLGSRITQLRKEQGITQVQLAELLGVSQQTITAYETGRRRIQVSNLPVIAKTLHVTIEELIGSPTRASKRGPVGKLQLQVERINQLPRTKQQFVMQVIDSVLAQATR
ncbi:helix-turn-helix domain-containing protein [Solilutibacter silvestris]|uniref:Helix-turn-helix protein n=1 Tax=Solilutibacter silvestris TaxID=1645665 RepID=A0A2K1Q4G4_9GAMM|nr:helix-turn-helix domain-containing protein [Lysobacter silvestris]PNS09847.1 helix-turn-helix protein [Lysobacter silvestris]PNS09852.1 helix-turn-helix protein [Lysobacter silvestris]